MAKNRPTESSTEWEWGEGQVIREDMEPHAPDDMAMGKTEYRIKRRLTDDEGRRYYHVEEQNKDTHLYAADTLRLNYEAIPETESQTWPRGEDSEVFD